MKMKFGGYTIGAGMVRSQLPPAENPDDQTIEVTVGHFAQQAGVLAMRCDPAPDIGPYELVLYAEGGRYLPMLNEILDTGEPNTRTLTNNPPESGMASLLGEMYPAAAVTKDIELVSTLFSEFARTGSVSVTKMN